VRLSLEKRKLVNQSYDLGGAVPLTLRQMTNGFLPPWDNRKLIPVR